MYLHHRVATQHYAQRSTTVCAIVGRLVTFSVFIDRDAIRTRRDFGGPTRSAYRVCGNERTAVGGFRNRIILRRRLIWLVATVVPVFCNQILYRYIFLSFCPVGHFLSCTKKIGTKLVLYQKKWYKKRYIFKNVPIAKLCFYIFKNHQNYYSSMP